MTSTGIKIFGGARSPSVRCSAVRQVYVLHPVCPGISVQNPFSWPESPKCRCRSLHILSRSLHVLSRSLSKCCRSLFRVGNIKISRNFGVRSLKILTPGPSSFAKEGHSVATESRPVMSEGFVFAKNWASLINERTFFAKTISSFVKRVFSVTKESLSQAKNIGPVAKEKSSALRKSGSVLTDHAT